MKKFALLGVSLLIFGMSASVNAATVVADNNQNPNANIKQNLDEDFNQFNHEGDSANNNRNDNDEFAELDSKDKTLQENPKYAWNNSQDNDPDQIDAIVQGNNTESDVGFAD